MKKPSTSILACATLILGLGGCASTLPSQRPSDLTIRMTRGGGHALEGKPAGDELLLTGTYDSHYKLEYGGGGAVSVALDVSDDDLDAIYAVLRENGFDRLSGANGSSGHGPGTYVTIKSDAFEYTAHVNGDKNVDRQVKKKWENVVSALKSYKKQEIENMGVVIPATFDASPFGAALPIQKELE